jgi:hypothetical protein
MFRGDEEVRRGRAAPARVLFGEVDEKSAMAHLDAKAAVPSSSVQALEWQTTQAE